MIITRWQHAKCVDSQKMKCVWHLKICIKIMVYTGEPDCQVNTLHLIVTIITAISRNNAGTLEKRAAWTNKFVKVLNSEILERINTSVVSTIGKDYVYSSGIFVQLYIYQRHPFQFTKITMKYTTSARRLISYFQKWWNHMKKQQYAAHSTCRIQRCTSSCHNSSHSQQTVLSLY